MNTNVNILSHRKLNGEHLAAHEDYALTIANQLSAISNGTEPGEDNDNEPMSFYEFLDDPLDDEFRTGAWSVYRSVKIAITLGGPGCWIDSDLQAVVCLWGSGTCICEYGQTHSEQVAITESIDELFSQYYMLSVA